MDERALREAIIIAANSWKGTPFHDDARVKGVGVDCAQFVAAAYLEARVVSPFDVPRYGSQWFLHKSEERLINFVLAVGGVEIDEAKAGKGDLVLYKLGRAYAHAAIIVDWPSQILHAHKRSRMVLAARPFDGDLSGLKTRFFSLWP